MRTVVVGAVALVALVASGACEQQQQQQQHAPGTAVASSAAKGGPVYRFEVAPPETCKLGHPCAVRARLTALGQFHVNREYPFKFVPGPSRNVEHDAGAFAIESDAAGTLTVTFRATVAGTAHVAGSFKLSVCSTETCEIETAAIAVDVPVT